MTEETRSDNNMIGHPNFYLNIHPSDVPFVRSVLSVLVGDQHFYIKNGIAHYSAIAKGTTRKGFNWVNSHAAHRQNTAVDIRPRALPWLVGNGIDIGCGIEKIVPDCIGVDNAMDYGDMTDADDVRDASDLSGYADGQFDWLFSSNTLEHIENWRKALDEWVRVVRVGGVIFLDLPWADWLPMHAAGATPNHMWNPSPSIMRRELESRNVSILHCDEKGDAFGCFVIVGRKHEG